MKFLLQDLRYGLRQLRRAPGFAMAAVLILALGIGVNGAIFSTANAVLWRALPVSDPQSLVRLAAVRQDGSERDELPTALADDLRRTSAVFSDIIAEDDDGLSFAVEGGRAERVVAQVVSPNFFTFLGVRAVLGQGFSAEVQKGRWAPEVVLSYRFWQREFNGDPHVLGRVVRLNGDAFTIVGVSPSDFYSLAVGFDPELRLPHLPAGQEIGQIHLLSDSDASLMARLKPGIGMAQAEAATDAESQQLLRAHVQEQRRDNPVRRVRLLPGDRGWEGDLAQFRQPLLILFGLAGLVLLIAATNLAGMLFARAAGRKREFALRAAIGAGRARLVRQMLTESSLLSLAGGALAYAIVSHTGNLVLGFLPQGHVSIRLDLAPDSRVAWFTMGLTLLTGVLFGLMPALQATRGELSLALKTDSAASVGDGAASTLRRALVAGQVALSVVLLMAAGLLWRSVSNLRAGDLFPQPNRVLLFTLKPQVELYTAEHIRSLTADIVQRASQLAGVKSAALAENGPLGSRWDEGSIETIDGRSVRAAIDLVSPGYFTALDTAFIAGRDFSPTDRLGSPPVVIVNEELARRLFKNENPLGKIISPPANFDGYFDVRGPLQIVGVVPSVRYYDLHEAPPPAIYLDMQQGTAYMPTLHVRLETGANAADVIGEVQREFGNVDKNFPVFNIRTLADRVNDSLARERLVSQLAGGFGCLALVLVVTGLYGMMAYTVTRRTREIGIRMALGADRANVLGMVLRQGLSTTALGVGTGLLAAWVLGRFLASMLYGVRETDPVTLMAVAILLGGVALLASYVPARRATRVDPMIALRYE
jgi:predicted permease